MHMYINTADTGHVWRNKGTTQASWLVVIFFVSVIRKVSWQNSGCGSILSDSRSAAMLMLPNASHQVPGCWGWKALTAFLYLPKQQLVLPDGGWGSCFCGSYILPGLGWEGHSTLLPFYIWVLKCPKQKQENLGRGEKKNTIKSHVFFFLFLIPTMFQPQS